MSFLRRDGRVWTTEIYTIAYTLSLHDALPIFTTLIRLAAV